MCLSKVSRSNTGGHGAIDPNIAAREPGFVLKCGSRDTPGYYNPPVDFRSRERATPRNLGPLQWPIAHCTWGASLSNRATISPRRAASRCGMWRTAGLSRTRLWDCKWDYKSVIMHEITGQVHWHEPSGFKRAGFGKFGRPKTPYDLFMESEGVPVYRNIGV